ncbi:hypothetical protein Mal33_53520 [Rosistilla oblonga]|uniref:Uncharacterized protein n=1 Tax=Rosistilla oblonga TaxID=2527990 RepID=A0A518J1W0_9BACT|nr:hypothetical protein Mal33_53520 [Rosistilla oblonga]
MLGSFLSNHPQIYWGNERFNPTFWAPLRFATIQASCTNLPCYGTKCFLHHLARVPKDDFGKRLLNEFSQAGWKTISLKRVNCFRHALSIEKALSSNRFLQLKGGPPHRT